MNKSDMDTSKSYNSSVSSQLSSTYKIYEVEAVTDQVDRLIARGSASFVISHIVPEICSLIRTSFIYAFFGFELLSPFISVEIASTLLLIIPRTFGIVI